MKAADLQYLYIAGLVVGSIFGMSHRVLVQAFMRMFVPLFIGTIAAAAAGVLVGLLFGFDPKHTWTLVRSGGDLSIGDESSTARH